jgi:hypothetical protein
MGALITVETEMFEHREVKPHWGFWVWHGKDPFWVAISYVGDGPQEAPAQWVIPVNYDPGLSLIRRLFHKPDRQVLEQLRNHVLQAIISKTAIKPVPQPLN